MRVARIIVGLGCFALAISLGFIAIETSKKAIYPVEFFHLRLSLVDAVCAIGLVLVGRRVIGKKGEFLSKRSYAQIAVTILAIIVVNVGWITHLPNLTMGAFRRRISTPQQMDAAIAQWSATHDQEVGHATNSPSTLTNYIFQVPSQSGLD